MNLLLDTHLLVWAVTSPRRMSHVAAGLIEDPDNNVFFSPISIWEIVVKSALNRADFTVDPVHLNDFLLTVGYRTLPVETAHALAVRTLPGLHKDPFDRMLIAQAVSEGLVLLTADAQLGRYPGPIRLV